MWDQSDASGSIKASQRHLRPERDTTETQFEASIKLQYSNTYTSSLAILSDGVDCHPAPSMAKILSLAIFAAILVCILN